MRDERARSGHRSVTEPHTGGTAEHSLESLERHAARSHDLGRLGGAVDDRRLDTDVGRTPVEHDIDVGPQVRTHVRGGRGAHATEPVRRRRCDAPGERVEQRQRKGMSGHAQTNSLRPARHHVGHGVSASGNEQRQRSRPEGLREAACILGEIDGPGVDGVVLTEVHDQWMTYGPALDFEDATDGIGIRRVGTKAVDGLGREGHEAAPTQHSNRTTDVVVGLLHGCMFENGENPRVTPQRVQVAHARALACPACRSAVSSGCLPPWSWWSCSFPSVLSLRPSPRTATTDTTQAGNELTAGKAAVLGVVEGVTEFLPVSSTGHLLVTQRLMDIGTTPETKKAADAYAIAIQSGAILAVVLLYWRSAPVDGRGSDRS